MLTALSIRNVVLIEKLDLEFGQGLNVFTGETGAGKSILLDSLSLALGARADSNLVRHGCEGLTVVARFAVSLSHSVHHMLIESGIEGEDEIILKRTVSKEGKSKAFVNDQPVSAALLKNIGDSLVEIHGQFASHHLLNPATHIGVLDAYGLLEGEESSCRGTYKLWQYKKAEREQAEQNLFLVHQEETFLRESIVDLRQLNPVADEEDELIQKRTSLMNSEKIMTCLNMAYQILSDETQGASHKVEQALGQLEKANTMSRDSFAQIVESAEQASQALADVVAHLESATEEWGDTGVLPQIDDRLFALKDMARKHQVTVAELSELLRSFEEKLASLEHGEEQLIQLRKAEETARLEYIACAQKLSQKRGIAGKKLDAEVASELPDLKLSKASFLTEIVSVPESEWSEKGIDRVTFLVSTNTGIPFAPIHKVASGGELARFMLALKVNLASVEQMVALVFDEVDSGVGGATADAVGNRLKRLADECQVLVVTHSPQVAAHGEHHFTVSKKDTGKCVITDVQRVCDTDRLMEVARMLSGAKITESGQKMAAELLDKSCKKNQTN